ncbi:MAG: Si-specific NAD(P)(+) transhydrogenase [Candidatus Anammoxibacter sp.]
MQKKYDVIVIGSGPGGEGATMKAVKECKHVAIVDDFPDVGGSCTHRGTIPSKALRHAIQRLADTNSFRDISYQGLLESAKSVISEQVDLRQSFYEKNLVDIINGYAVFQDEHTVEITLTGGGKETYTAQSFIIATGSRPYHPPDIDFSHPRIVDSDSILNLKDNPRSITIYGAGVIGCEYSSIFRGLRIKVNLINTRNQLLSFLDDEIIDALSYHLREQGVLLRHNELYEKVETNKNEVCIHLKSNKQIHSDVLLWAQGRTGNADHMGLDGIGVKTDERGSIIINDNYQTARENIYAVGDVVGYPNLASAAYDQGRFAATHMIFGKCEYRLVDNIPTGIYTIPEISSVGLTERELTAAKVPYEVGHTLFKQLARAQITGHTTGMLKLLFHRDSLEILGIHCFGYQASEIIHIGQAIMAQKNGGNTLMYFINTTFNYPTMAEAYRVAALNGLNRIRSSTE